MRFSPLKITGLAFIGLVAGAFLVILFYSPVPKTDAPLNLASLSDTELFARGLNLVTAGNCASCHTASGGKFMAGGVAFETEFGTIYSTNITPDPETGIGDWSDRDFLNSMRYGVRPSGEHLYPAFPYTSFHKITEEDMAAIYHYLQRVPAVNQTAPQNSLDFPYSLRPLMAFWKFLYFRPEVYQPLASQSEDWNRGAYLVEGLAHCSACHTPRGFLGAEIPSEHMSGGEYLDRIPGGEHRYWSAPNLTNAAQGLSLWSQEDLFHYLKTGQNSFLESFGPMNEVIMNSTRYLPEDDVQAMALYLKTLDAVEEQAGPLPDDELMGQGRTIYNLHCGTCHLPSGQGDPQMGPALNAASLVVQSDNPASMINAILYGPQLPQRPGESRWLEPMAAYQYMLNDEEVAALASFIRNSWDNRAGEVSAEQVSRQR